MCVAKCLEGAVLLSLLTVVVSLEALGPEEAAYIKTQCLADNAGQKDCLIKCILQKSGLYNPGTKKFQAEMIRKQQEKYPDLVPKGKADAYADAFGKLPRASTCRAVSAAYLLIQKQYRKTSVDLFHKNLFE